MTRRVLECSATIALEFHQILRLERLIGRTDAGDSIEPVRPELGSIVHYE